MSLAEVKERQARRRRLRKAGQRHERYQQEHRKAEKQALALVENRTSTLGEQKRTQLVVEDSPQSIVGDTFDPTNLTEHQGRRKFTAIEMIAAIKASKGFKSHAARRLGCDWATVDKYCKDFPAVEQAYQETREQLIDLAESKFRKKIIDDFWPAIRFALATVGKNRGYTERIEQVLIPRSEAIREFQSDLDRAYGQDVDAEGGSEGGLPEGSD